MSNPSDNHPTIVLRIRLRGRRNASNTSRPILLKPRVDIDSRESIATEGQRTALDTIWRFFNAIGSASKR
jgi:hypothetical protein